MRGSRFLPTIATILGALAILWPSFAHAGFFQELVAKPWYEHAPSVSVQRHVDLGVPNAVGLKDLEIGPRAFSLLLLGPTDDEAWTLRIKAKLLKPLGGGDSMFYLLNSTENPVHPNPDSNEVVIEIPLHEAVTRFDLYKVDVAGAVQRERMQVKMSHLPLAATPNKPSLWRMEATMGLHFGYEAWNETNSLGTTTNTNFKLPRIEGEIGVRRSKTPHSPSWRLQLLASIEYSLPQTASSTNFAYGLGWTTALRFSRTHLLGRVPGLVWAPFIQLERQSEAFATSQTTTENFETFNVLVPAAFFSIWASLGIKAERVYWGRNWEFTLLAGRSIIAGAWNSTGYLYWLGGWLGRASVRADITRRIWAEASGQFSYFSGGATLLGGGGGLSFGLRF